MIDPTTLLAELAAIQRDVRTIHEAVDLHHVRIMPEATRHVVDRLAALMSSIASPPPVGHSRIDDGSDPRTASYRMPSGNVLTVGVADDVSLDQARAFVHVIEHGGPIKLPPEKWSVKVDRPPAAPPPVGLPPISAESEAMVSQLMAANMPAATTSRKLAVDNGMLAPIRARLDELERKVESLTKSADGYEWAVGMGHHIKALVGRHIFIDGGDPGDEQEAS